MNVSQDELFYFLLRKCMVLEANLTVLSVAFQAHLDMHKPGASADYKSNVSTLVQAQLEEILLEHPYGDFSEIQDLINPPE